MGYLTYADFIIYESVNYLKLLLPHEMERFPHLCGIRDKVASLTAIREYEESRRAVKEFSPIRYFRHFKEKKKRKDKGGCSTADSGACMASEGTQKVSCDS